MFYEGSVYKHAIPYASIPAQRFYSLVSIKLCAANGMSGRRFRGV